MSDKISELFTHRTDSEPAQNWREIVYEQHCPILGRSCLKTRKSEPTVAIGTCTVKHGKKSPQTMIICPHRFLAKRQIFLDSIHLLRLHEPGNQIHILPEIDVPGGSVDYVLASVWEGKVVDFVGIELQALDTTGSIWPARQDFLREQIGAEIAPVATKPYGINWKMTAKTTLVQMHHKIETFEHLGKHLVLVLQDVLMAYMANEFNFSEVQAAKMGHALHLHSYQLTTDYALQLAQRYSTDSAGMAMALGLQADAHIGLANMLARLESRLSDTTRWVIGR